MTDELAEREAPDSLNGKAGCSCVSDPFADLPPEMRPVLRSATSGLRKVTCPGCGLEYRTNRKTEFCMACEHKGR